MVLGNPALRGFAELGFHHGGHGGTEAQRVSLSFFGPAQPDEASLRRIGVLEFLGELIGLLLDACLCGLFDFPSVDDDGDWKPKV